MCEREGECFTDNDFVLWVYSGLKREPERWSDLDSGCVMYDLIRGGWMYRCNVQG